MDFDFINALKGLEAELDSAKSVDEIKAIKEKAELAKIKIEEEREKDIFKHPIRYSTVAYVPYVTLLGGATIGILLGYKYLPYFKPFKDLAVYLTQKIAEFGDRAWDIQEMSAGVAPILGGTIGVIAGFLSYPITGKLPQWYLKLILLPHYDGFDNYKGFFDDLVKKADRKMASKIEI